MHTNIRLPLTRFAAQNALFCRLPRVRPARNYAILEANLEFARIRAEFAITQLTCSQELTKSTHVPLRNTAFQNSEAPAIYDVFKRILNRRAAPQLRSKRALLAQSVQPAWHPESAYSVGSAIRASPNARRRSAHLLQCPQ